MAVRWQRDRPVSARARCGERVVLCRAVATVLVGRPMFDAVRAHRRPHITRSLRSTRVISRLSHQDESPTVDPTSALGCDPLQDVKRMSEPRSV